jgi:hypothetical protein
MTLTRNPWSKDHKGINYGGFLFVIFWSMHHWTISLSAVACCKWFILFHFQVLILVCFAGEGLGSEKRGRADPIMAGDVKQDHLGVGAVKPGEVSTEDDIYEQYKKRMMLGYRYRPNPLVWWLSFPSRVSCLFCLLTLWLCHFCRTIPENNITDKRSIQEMM